MSALNDPVLRNLKRRLERWELAHLREHAAELAARLESIEAELVEERRQRSLADDAADYWNRQFHQLEESLDERDPPLQLGLTQAGNFVVCTGATA